MSQTGRVTLTCSSVNSLIRLRKNESRVGNIDPIRDNRITCDGGRKGT
jgi:hypothetical protein